MRIDTPVLENGLTEIERLNLTQTVQSPGWDVVIKIINAVCQRANDEVIAVDQDDENFDTKVSSRTRAARSASDTAALSFKSIDYHTQVSKEVEKAKLEPKPEVSLYKKVFNPLAAKQSQ